jgi:hypothetical protein
MYGNRRFFDFYRRVNQAAHELSQRHGRGTHQYAARLAEQTKSENGEDYQFWVAVAAALAPRTISNRDSAPRSATLPPRPIFG